MCISSYFIKDQTFLNRPIQPNISDKSFPLSCKTSSDVKIIEKQISENEVLLLEDKVAWLEENVSFLKTEIKALRSFITEQLSAIKNSERNILSRFITIPIKWTPRRNNLSSRVM